jgi:hypothetical protein
MRRLGYVLKVQQEGDHGRPFTIRFRRRVRKESADDPRGDRGTRYLSSQVKRRDRRDVYIVVMTAIAKITPRLSPCGHSRAVPVTAEFKHLYRKGVDERRGQTESSPVFARLALLAKRIVRWESSAGQVEKLCGTDGQCVGDRILHTICCSRTMDLGLQIAVHARKKSFLRHTAEPSLVGIWQFIAS